MMFSAVKIQITTSFASAGGLWDRFDQQYVVVDVDGTKQAARQRALPQLPSLPSPHRRFDLVAAPGYKGRWPSFLWSRVAVTALKRGAIFFFLDTGNGVTHQGHTIVELKT